MEYSLFHQPKILSISHSLSKRKSKRERSILLKTTNQHYINIEQAEKSKIKQVHICYVLVKNKLHLFVKILFSIEFIHTDSEPTGKQDLPTEGLS